MNSFSNLENSDIENKHVSESEGERNNQHSQFEQEESEKSNTESAELFELESPDKTKPLDSDNNSDVDEVSSLDKKRINEKERSQSTQLGHIDPINDQIQPNNAKTPSLVINEGPVSNNNAPKTIFEDGTLDGPIIEIKQDEKVEEQKSDPQSLNQDTIDMAKTSQAPESRNFIELYENPVLLKTTEELNKQRENIIILK